MLLSTIYSDDVRDKIRKSEQIRRSEQTKSLQDAVTESSFRSFWYGFLEKMGIVWNRVAHNGVATNEWATGSDAVKAEIESIYLSGIIAEQTVFSIINQVGKADFQKAAAKGHPASRFHVRFMEYCDEAVPLRSFCIDDRVKKWLENEARKGSLEALYLLGKLCQCMDQSEGSRFVKYWVEGDDYERECFEKAAENGHVPAQYELGCWFEAHLADSWSTYESDFAMKWVLKAAEAGFLPAQLKLGSFFSEGRCARIDHEEAFKWYLKAAEQGNERAQYEVGHRYCEGIGVERDIDNAIKWFRKSSSYQRSKWALEELGADI
ncbi:MAG: sel1 repeat family protein [Ruminococcus sp.]|nr:sel1 repeat family protein [Ruminococcus sp.]